MELEAGFKRLRCDSPEFLPIRQLISRRTPSRVRQRQQRVNTNELPTLSLESPSLEEPNRRHSTLNRKFTTMSTEVNAVASQAIPKKALQPVTCTHESAVLQYFRRLIRQKAGFEFAS